MNSKKNPNKAILSAAWALCLTCIIAAWFCDALAPDDRIKVHAVAMSNASR